MTSDIIKRASEFASKAHNGQVRKYTGEPYFGHPVEVMEIVSEVIDDPEVHAARPSPRCCRGYSSYN